MYRVGIARKAEPLAKIKDDYERFKIRMVERVRRDLEREDHQFNFEDEAGRRTAFNELSRLESSRLHSRVGVGVSRGAQPDVVGNAGWGQRGGGASSSARAVGGRGGFTVFDENSVPTTSLADGREQFLQEHKSLFDLEPQWRQLKFPMGEHELEAEPTARAENQQPLSSWGTVKIKQAVKTSTVAPAFEMFVDDEFKTEDEKKPMGGKFGFGAPSTTSSSSFKGFGTIRPFSQDHAGTIEDRERGAPSGGAELPPFGPARGNEPAPKRRKFGAVLGEKGAPLGVERAGAELVVGSGAAASSTSSGAARPMVDADLHQFQERKRISIKSGVPRGSLILDEISQPIIVDTGPLTGDGGNSNGPSTTRNIMLLLRNRIY